MGKHRTAILLTVLGVVLGWVALTTWMPGADEASATPSAAPASGRGSAKKGKGLIQAADVPVVIAGLAHGRAAEDFLRERSLFDFSRSPDEIAAEEEARRKAAQAAQEQAAAAAQRALEQAEEEKIRQALNARRLEEERKAREQMLLLNPPKPDPPSFPYQYVGTIGPSDDPFAILTGPDRAFRYARAGETIDDKFKLEYIAEARLDLSFTDPRFADQFAQVQRNFDTASKSR